MSTTQKKCPMCAEEIPLTAATCEYCGAHFKVTSMGYCQNCHQVRDADINGQCKICGKAVLDLRMESRFVEEPVQKPLPVAQPIAQAEITKTGKSRLPFSFLMGILILAVIGALVWFGQNSLPAVSSLFATVTPTATTTFIPTITSTPTLPPTRTPPPTPTITPDLRVLNPANQHQYLYVQESKPWHQARDYCTLQGGHLVTIQDRQENKYVYELTSGYTWLGATDEVKEGAWVWVTGEHWNYSVWNPGEPTNNTGHGKPQHYLQFQLYAHDLPSTFWDDAEDGPFYFVCEWESSSP